MDVVNDTLLNATGNATAGNFTLGGSILASTVLFILAIVPIYVGSLLSPRFHKSQSEVLTSKDAAMFPVIASGALMGIYVLFKFLPREYINLLVTLHFSFIGIGSISHCLGPFLRNFFPTGIPSHVFKFEYTRSVDTGADDETTGELIEKHTFQFSTKDLLGFFVGLCIGVWYFFTRHWIANNLIALTICIMAIKYIRLNKFYNGFLLLGGLFFYDIFWVFGTPVMVTVAKNLDAPIKVVFPRDFLTNGLFGKQLALLGLGDIVIPGIFVAMLLRFDLSLNRNGSRIYFHTGYAAYILGLLITFVVMHTFNAAQPALLYLVPTCLGFPLLLAWIQRDIPLMFSYQDVPEAATASESDTKKSS